ncbi:hypothetical protein SAMN05421820_106416 [Pedobacter steynii]|uniref:Uncharacterized protein n=1 Tax=Pedobacter steynii TaxID=430522 RepID=A0A1G9ZBL8_9SPHI|nr:hypothetical protein SAMN05421820_106416 [Pedobacter steynii]
MELLLLKHFLFKLSVFYNFCFDQGTRFVVNIHNYEKISHAACHNPVLLLSARIVYCTTTKITTENETKRRNYYQ